MSGSIEALAKCSELVWVGTTVSFACGRPMPCSRHDEPEWPMSGRYVDDEAERASFAALGDELERGERP